MVCNSKIVWVLLKTTKKKYLTLTARSCDKLKKAFQKQTINWFSFQHSRKQSINLSDLQLGKFRPPSPRLRLRFNNPTKLIQMASFENFKLQLRPHLYGQQFPGTKMQLPNAFTWGAPLAWPMRFEKWFNGAIALHLFADFGFISPNHP